VLSILKTHRGRDVAVIVALAVPVVSAASLLAASQPAAARRIARAATAYCIPPATASAAATENAENTSVVLSTSTEGGLASAGSVSVPVDASSAGTIAIKLTAKKTIIGSGSASVTESGCFQLTITLTSSGKQLLQRDEESRTPIKLLITSKFTPVKGSGKAATATATATVNP
jgi:hypothetical protein